MVNQKVINSPPFLYHLPILSFSLILIPKTSLTLISNSISNYAFDFISILTFLRQRSLEHDGSVIITLLSIFSSSIFWLFFFCLGPVFTSLFEEGFGFLSIRSLLVLELSSNDKRCCTFL